MGILRGNGSDTECKQGSSLSSWLCKGLKGTDVDLEVKEIFCLSDMQMPLS